MNLGAGFSPVRPSSLDPRRRPDDPQYEPMIGLASGIDYVDLNFLGYPNIIATAVLHGPGGVALIDPGPSTSLPTSSTLERERAADGRRSPDPARRTSTWTMAARPGRSSRRTRRSRCSSTSAAHRTWRIRRSCSRALAPVRPGHGSAVGRVPGGSRRAAPRVCRAAKPIAAGGRTLEVAYTPGHASHHVSYFEPSSRIAFVGDTAGIRRGSGEVRDAGVAAARRRSRAVARKRGEDPRAGIPTRCS